MAEYIERGAVQKMINRLANEPHYYHRDETFFDGIATVNIDLCDIPTADVVEVKHGEWESKGTHGDFEEKRCSICNGLLLVRWYDRTMEYRYCPNCGAKMDLKEGAEE